MHIVNIVMWLFRLCYNTTKSLSIFKAKMIH